MSNWGADVVLCLEPLAPSATPSKACYKLQNAIQTKVDVIPVAGRISKQKSLAIKTTRVPSFTFTARSESKVISKKERNPGTDDISYAMYEMFRVIY